MNKKEFERSCGGIKKGDLVLAVDETTIGSNRPVLFIGVYDPIDTEDHWYRSNCKSARPNEGYVLLSVPAMSPSDENEITNYCPYLIQRDYEGTKEVRLLMKGEEVKKLLKKHYAKGKK